MDVERRLLKRVTDQQLALFPSEHAKNWVKRDQLNLLGDDLKSDFEELNILRASEEQKMTEPGENVVIRPGFEVTFHILFGPPWSVENDVSRFPVRLLPLVMA